MTCSSMARGMCKLCLEMRDCTREGVFQLDLRLPFQQRLRSGNIRSAYLGIVQWKRMIADGTR